ncbi:MAG TPA: CapA family protein [Beijerinckiaceae bacterium]|nr:CapA family protein [Beijerinckiaceae bacterium]
MSYASAAGNFSIAVAGDCMLTRSLKTFDEPAFLAVRDKFRDCDAGFVNLESVVRRWDEGTPGITQGTFMTTPPELLHDMKWFGINMVSCANNHAFDYGEGGVLATLSHLDAAGIAHAGSGRNLAEARMPAYLDTKGGRVALLATTATFRPWNRAGAQRPDLRGRAGINPFHSASTYTVDGEAFEALKRMSRELGLDQTRARDRTHFYSDSEAPADRAEELSIFGQQFVRGERFTLTSAGNEADAEDNLRWIREARRQADWVVVSFHSHGFSQRSMATAKTRIDLHEPADFIPDFAHAAIDAGADIFVGHGSHTPLGLELYRGKPIFYSLGNLVLQNETVPFFPEEAYARFGLGHDATPADFLDARTDGGRKGHVAHAGFWENIFATCHFESGKLAEIRIVPIDQGFGQPRGQRGRPVLATGDMARRIIERVGRLSEPYGVQIRVIDGIGVVRAD